MTIACFRQRFLESYMIFVDSQADLRAISSVWCISRLTTFRPNRIRLCWLSDHSGILGKETTDALARVVSFSEGDLIVCHLYGLINGWVWGEEQRQWVGLLCFWVPLACYRLLSLDKASLRLVMGFITNTSFVTIQPLVCWGHFAGASLNSLSRTLRLP